MGNKTKIEWTDATWNPIRGCTRVSEGCRHCYAEGVAARFSGPGQPYEGLAVMNSDGPHWTGKVQLVEKHLADPLRWRKPKRIFVNSMSDLFHEALPDEAIDCVFAVMALAPHHTFQVLTKRARRAHAYLNDESTPERIATCIGDWFGEFPQLRKLGERLINTLHGFDANEKAFGYPTNDAAPWPLPNVWLGVSAEDQRTADERIPLLLETPAAVRWISAEPLLGPIDLQSLPFGHRYENGNRVPSRRLNCLKRTLHLFSEGDIETPALDWVVVGGESGPGARPMHPDWARKLRDQCQAAGVPFFFKQWGEWEPVTPLYEGRDDEAEDGRDPERLESVSTTGHIYTEHDGQPSDMRTFLMERVGKKAAGRLLDGREWNEYPESQGGEVESAKSS